LNLLFYPLKFSSCNVPCGRILSLDPTFFFPPLSNPSMIPCSPPPNAPKISIALSGRELPTVHSFPPPPLFFFFSSFSLVVLFFLLLLLLVLFSQKQNASRLAAGFSPFVVFFSCPLTRINNFCGRSALRHGVGSSHPLPPFRFSCLFIFRGLTLPIWVFFFKTPSESVR